MHIYVRQYSGIFFFLADLLTVSQQSIHCLRKFVVAEKGLSTSNTLHFSDFLLQLYGLVNKSFSNYAGMAHFLIESQVPLF